MFTKMAKSKRVLAVCITYEVAGIVTEVVCCVCVYVFNSTKAPGNWSFIFSYVKCTTRATMRLFNRMCKLP